MRALVCLVLIGCGGRGGDAQIVADEAAFQRAVASGPHDAYVRTGTVLADDLDRYYQTLSEQGDEHFERVHLDLTSKYLRVEIETDPRADAASIGSVVHRDLSRYFALEPLPSR